MADTQTNDPRTPAEKEKQETKQGQTAKAGAPRTKTTRGSRKGSTAKEKKQVIPPQEKIAERAKTIWYERNCRPGEDERNWFEAENQLIKQELGVH